MRAEAGGAVPSEPAVIDLGALGPTGSDPDEPWFGRDSARRPFRDVVRRLLVAVVAAGTLATATAAAPPRRALVPVFALEVGQSGDGILDGDALHVLTSLPGRAELTSYRMSDGAVRWRASVEPSVGGGGAGLALFGEVLVASVSDGVQPQDEPVGRSTAYDARSGAMLWRLGGWVVARAAGGRLLVSRETRESVDGTRLSYEFEAIEPRSRVPAWTIRLPAGAASYVVYDWFRVSGDGLTRMVAVGDAGRLRSYDLATGSLLADRQLPHWAVETQVEVVGDSVVVSTPDGFLADVRAYGVDDMVLRWEARGEMGVMGCGRWICLPTAAGVRAIHPVTGERMWERRDMAAAFPADPAWPAGTLIAVRQDGTGNELADADTGRTVAELGAWSPVAWGEGPPLLVRAPSFTGTPGSWLARFRPDLGSAEIVSALPDVTFCTASNHYLACRGAGKMWIWRLQV
jgi:hypothetical protein